MVVGAQRGAAGRAGGVGRGRAKIGSGGIGGGNHLLVDRPGRVGFVAGESPADLSGQQNRGKRR